MWRLIWKDSLRDRRRYYGSTLYLLPINLINIINISDGSDYGMVCAFYMVFSFIILFIYPLKLAKGLYLCPLTEADRKKYLVTAAFIRLFRLLFVLIPLLLCGHFYMEVPWRTLAIQVLFFMMFLIGIILISGYYSTSTAIQEYAAFRKSQGVTVPVAQKKKVKTDTFGIVSLTITTATGFLGVIAMTSAKAMLEWRLYVYAVVLIIAAITTILYFIKSFDKSLTINANCEVYFYFRKKKAGIR